MTPVNIHQPSTEASRPQYRFPVTQTQSRCWFLNQLTPGNPALNIAVRWELRGVIRDESVEAAFRQIIARHEIFRTRIVEHDGAPVQEVLETADFKLSVVDIRNTPEEGHARQIDAIAQKTGVLPFDLGRPPLIRATLVRCAQDRAMLLITAHQSIFDGFSIGVLGREFGQIAETLESGAAADLPPLPLQYGDYALWQQEYLASEAIEEDKAFWKKQLAGAPYFEVEPDLPRPAIRSNDGAMVFADLPSSFGETLEREARRHGVSGFAYGAAILSAVLHRLTGRPDILIGTQIAGRSEVDLEPLIGVFINNIVLRIPAAPDTTLAAQFRTAGQVVHNALLHQNMPFNKLVEMLNPRRDPARTPLISVNLDLARTTFFQNRKYSKFEIVSRPSHAPGAIYDLSFLLIGRPDSWRLSLEYSTDLFLRDTAQRILDQLVASFAFAFANPDVPLSALPEPGPRAAATPVVAPPPDGASPSVRSEPGVRPRLAAIWGNLLGRDPRELSGDFFDLGGHSLLVVRMLARVEAEFGVKFGLGEFLADPTLEAFAARIDARAPAHTAPRSGAGSSWELIILRQSDREDTVVLSINHSVLYYGLKPHLAAGTTLVNLRMPDRAAIAAQADMDFDAIVEDAIRHVRERLSGRRIVVTGLCVNGRVALRLAQALAEAGEDIALVAMVDTWAPAPGRSRATVRRYVWATRRRRWIHYVRQFLQGSIGGMDLLRKNSAADRMLRLFGRAEAPSSEEDIAKAVTDHLVAKTRACTFQPYRGEAALFRSDSSPAEAGERLFGWEGLLREDTPVYPLSGWHEDALRKTGIARMARIIGQRLGNGGGLSRAVD